MMKLRIDSDNVEKLEAALAVVQRRASVNLLDGESLLGLAHAAEKELESLGIPKIQRSGAAYRYAPAGPWANSFQYGQGATSVHLVRYSSAWYLVEVERTKVYPKQREVRRLTITPEQCEKATEVLHKRFDVSARNVSLPAPSVAA